MHRTKDFHVKDHRCQIDCTNHDQVINKLESKSKDLYFFWRNYEWLYNKYYQLKEKENEPKDDPKEAAFYKRELQKYQEQIERLEQLNKQLKQQNQSLLTQNKTLSEEIDKFHHDGSLMQNDYRRQINRLSKSVEQYRLELENQQKKSLQAKRLLNRAYEQADDNKQKMILEVKKYQKIIEDLENTVDQLRLKMTTQPIQLGGNPDKKSQEEALRKTTTVMCESTMRTLEDIRREANRIVSQEMQIERNEIMRVVLNVIRGLSSQDIQMLIINK